MNKEELYRLADNIYEEAFAANTYWQILLRLNSYIPQYHDEMNYAPCFFHSIFQALGELTYFRLYKLYETGEALGIYELLNKCIENVDQLPDYEKGDYIMPSGEPYSYSCCLKRDLIESEYKWYPDYLKAGITSQAKNESNLAGCTVEFKSVYDYLLFYRKKLSSYHPVINSLRNRRSLIFAHAIPKVNYDYKPIAEKFPLSIDEMDTLLNFALEVCQFIIILLTDVTRPIIPTDIGDLENILEMVRQASTF